MNNPLFEQGSSFPSLDGNKKDSQTLLDMCN